MPGPTLKHFILQQRVLDLYRQAIRASKSIPDSRARQETIAWIRAEIERNRNLSDVTIIEDKLATGRRELRRIFPMISHSISGG